MLSADLVTLGGLALSAFLAATLLPGGSEAVFAGVLALRPSSRTQPSSPPPLPIRPAA